MAKSRRTCYYTDRKDLWKAGRPMSWWPSNKKNKVKSHRIERAWVSRLILEELKQLD
jgi:hypothetical protein